MAISKHIQHSSNYRSISRAVSLSVMLYIDPCWPVAFLIPTSLPRYTPDSEPMLPQMDLVSRTSICKGPPEAVRGAGRFIVIGEAGDRRPRKNPIATIFHLQLLGTPVRGKATPRD